MMQTKLHLLGFCAESSSWGAFLYEDLLKSNLSGRCLRPQMITLVFMHIMQLFANILPKQVSIPTLCFWCLVVWQGEPTTLSEELEAQSGWHVSLEALIPGAVQHDLLHWYGDASWTFTLWVSSSLSLTCGFCCGFMLPFFFSYFLFGQTFSCFFIAHIMWFFFFFITNRCVLSFLVNYLNLNLVLFKILFFLN